MRYLNIGLVFVGIILDIVAFKKRRFGHWFIYYECLAQIVKTFIPSARLFQQTEI